MQLKATGGIKTSGFDEMEKSDTISQSSSMMSAVDDNQATVKFAGYEELMYGDMVQGWDNKTSKQKWKLKQERMIFREVKRAFILYPEDKPKVYWDVYITIILLFSCISTPYGIAFGESDETFSYIIDFSFLIDIMIIMSSSYYDDECMIVEHRG